MNFLTLVAAIFVAIFVVPALLVILFSFIGAVLEVIEEPIKAIETKFKERL